MSQPRFDPRGAVDLSMLQKPTAAQAQAAAASAKAAAAAPPGVIVDLTPENFQQVVEGSATVPLIVAIGASRSATGEKLTPTLEKAAIAYRGRFVLARVDADAQPQIAQVFGVQGVPCALAVIQGQPLPLFQGSPSPEQVAQVLEQVLEAAAQAGVTGTVAGADAEPDAEPEPEPEVPPLHAAAYEAIERGDWAAATAAYQQALNENPGDLDAKAGLGQVVLMERLDGVTDPVADLQAADAAGPTAVEAQLLAADIEMAAGRVSAAFARLVAVVRATSGPERETARKRLVSLFELVDPNAEELKVARRNLALALF
ncbi:tetratricopeptide repeat protein [Miniimonas arenae]|uniref:Tetratricopeptide repeat protein n=1 Tax=Miniimonas arenae TaxID=676201 RepID=A0A5C5BEU7_9MICO|nr:tetratricopeptide repeat protein [Miniimonas arenae]TNU76170.1 tetratricopeptide repeat protein [Miniimonas arenae]